MNINSFSVENKILFKVNNEIISTIDIFNEITYLKLINPNLKSVNKKIYMRLQKFLIREHIKIELIKNNIEINVNEDNLNTIKKINSLNLILMKNLRTF